MKALCRFFGYDGCSTCKKARAWLESHGVAYDAVPIVELPPTVAELRTMVTASGLPARKWFNTSGQSYRALTAELGKDGVAALTDAQILERLAADGKLIKRPLLVQKRRVLVGFREEDYEALLLG